MSSTLKSVSFEEDKTSYKMVEQLEETKVCTLKSEIALKMLNTEANAIIESAVNCFDKLAELGR